MCLFGAVLNQPKYVKYTYIKEKDWMNSWCEFALIVNSFCVYNTQKGHLIETMEKWTDYGNRVTWNIFIFFCVVKKVKFYYKKNTMHYYSKHATSVETLTSSQTCFYVKLIEFDSFTKQPLMKINKNLVSML